MTTIIVKSVKKFFIALFVIQFLAIKLMSQTSSGKDTIPNMLIITAHPDDWEYAMGGTAYLLKDKYHIHIVIASKGERGLSKEPSAETAAIRVKESECAAGKVNGKLYFLDKIDGEIYADKEGVDSLVGLLNKLKPSLIFILWPIDKPDHAAASNMAQIALSKTGMIYDREIYFMNAGGFGSTTMHFEPKILVNTTNVWEETKKILRCHVCQNVNDKAVEGMEQNNRIYGRLNRTEFAEGFVPMFPFTSSRWDSNKKIKCSLFGL